MIKLKRHSRCSEVGWPSSLVVEVLDQALISCAFEGRPLRLSSGVAPVEVAELLHVGKQEGVDQIGQAGSDIVHYNLLLCRVEGDTPALGRIEDYLCFLPLRGDVRGVGDGAGPLGIRIAVGEEAGVEGLNEPFIENKRFQWREHAWFLPDTAIERRSRHPGFRSLH